jgi:hypothetical protein
MVVGSVFLIIVGLFFFSDRLVIGHRPPHTTHHRMKVDIRQAIEALV